MSKTVKRAMRVMIVGMVAMLGAKAEAHYIYVAGKYKYCGSECLDHDEDNHGMPIPILKEVPSVFDPITRKFGPKPGEVEVRVTAKLIRIECPQQPPVITKVSQTLVAAKKSNQWTYDPDQGTAFVFVSVDDSSLNTVCPESAQAEVKILKMSATANSYVCDPASPPDNPVCDDTKKLASTMVHNPCTLPSGADDGDPYSCPPPAIQHPN